MNRAVAGRDGRGWGVGRRGQGFVLLTVLVMILLASMLAVSLMFSLRADVTAQSAGAQQEQAWAAALSGIARATALAQSAVRNPVVWRDNAAAFQHQFVTASGDDQWYFSVYSAADSPTAELRFGLTDEAGKLSLFETDPAWLARLPHLDAVLIDALRSGHSPEALPEASTGTPPSPAGEISGLTNLVAIPAPSTAPTNGRPAAVESVPAVSLEEAFQRAGLDASLLHGEDANLNLHLDPSEDDGDAEWPPDDRNGLLDPGLEHWLTVDSYDPNVDSEGRPRINLNDPKADLSGLGLPQTALDYLAALRRAGKALAHPVELLGAEESLPDAAGKAVPMKSGIDRDNLAVLLDRCTATNATRLPGLINLNTAPAPVLSVIPGLGETGADAILAARTGLGAEEQRTPVWLLQRGLVTPEQFREIAPHLTTRSYQFEFRCLGYAIPSGRYRVLAAVIDVAPRPARLLAVRDLTRFGFPLPLELLQPIGP